MLNAAHAPLLELPSQTRPLVRSSPHVAASIQLSVVRSITELNELGPAWNELFARAGKPTQVFQTHAFCALWARTHLGARPATVGNGSGLAIITGYCDGRLVLIWPLVVEVRLGLRVVSWLGEPIAQYGDVILDPDRCAIELIDRAWACIRAELTPDVVRLRKVRADAVIATHLQRLGARESSRDEAPFVILASPLSQSFEERQSTKARKNRRRLMRRLEELGTVTFERLAGCPRSRERAGAGLAIKRRWIAARGLYSTAFADMRLDQFFMEAAADAGLATGCTIYSLNLDGRPLAVVLAFASERRMTLHVISYDLAFERSGVGVLALEAVLRECESSGLETVDLLAPAAQYKLDWADGSIDVVDHAVTVTLAGRAWVGLYDGFLRTHAKAALQGLPMPLRQLIAGYRTPQAS